MEETFWVEGYIYGELAEHHRDRLIELGIRAEVRNQNYAYQVVVFSEEDLEAAQGK